MVARLVGILGVRLVAVIAGVNETRTIRSWMELRGPHGNRLRILRFALQAAEAIETRYGERAAQSWFQGLNHRLLDRVPALVLKSAQTAQLDVVLDAEKNILDALNIFLEE